MIGFLLGLLAGIATPAQASVNTRATEKLGSVYITSLCNFITAGVLITALVLATEKALYIPLSEIAAQPLWIWLGGPCGAAIIMLNIICLPKLGSARNVMLIDFGQIMTGLVIDHFGLFGALRVAMSPKRALGALLVIAGVTLVSGVKLPGVKSSGEGISGETHGQGETVPVMYMLLAIICGIVCSAQIAINGTLKIYAGTALKATLISMSAGFITVTLIIIVTILTKGRGGIYVNGKVIPFRYRPWMLMGGVLAAVVVGGNALAAPLLGAGAVTILNLIGMMGAGLVIDATGFLGIEKKPVTLINIIGMLLMIAGAVLTSF